MRIGIHVRGFDKGRPVAVSKALERGAETIQIFASNPRQWRLPPTSSEADSDLRQQMESHDVAPLFLHAPYLVNLASPIRQTREQSIRTLEWTMRRGAELGARGVVVHAGQCAGGDRAATLPAVASALSGLVDSAPAGPQLLLELTAGAEGAVANRLPEAGELLDACDRHPRLGLCLDTCHLHAAGVDLGGEEQVAALVKEIESEVGLDRVELLHSNDSLHPLGSRRDRHWHIGEGQIGLEGFRALVRHPALRTVPMICETPGELDEDRRNIAALKGLRGLVTGG
ncbi:MAG: deoxyribonuclease IV [Actinomycetota bacterium]|nr:deoxyribonuclease IV [Actinomycetota bacterium]